MNNLPRWASFVLDLLLTRYLLPKAYHGLTPMARDMVTEVIHHVASAADKEEALMRVQVIRQIVSDSGMQPTSTVRVTMPSVAEVPDLKETP